MEKSMEEIWEELDNIRYDVCQARNWLQENYMVRDNDLLKSLIACSNLNRLALDRIEEAIEKCTDLQRKINVR